MKKLIPVIFVLMVILLVACKQAVKETPKQTGTPTAKPAEIPKVEITGEKAVDSVGSGINDVNSVEKDLSTDELSDLDSGLADISKI
ncbi:hypothetical protein J4234_00695 [Candidatus Woesearchaeota archaeon]|nr:hypothetical protein [Candidatus Woesearchaeota archaeon]